MSITIHQKRGLTKIGECYKKLEQLAADNNIDLDALMNVHKYEELDSFGKVKRSAQAVSENRKHIFEKEQKGKSLHPIKD